jgi:hypothetical protein
MLYASVHIVFVPAGTTVYPRTRTFILLRLRKFNLIKEHIAVMLYHLPLGVNSFVVGCKDDHLSHQWGDTGTIAAHVKT